MSLSICLLSIMLSMVPSLPCKGRWLMFSSCINKTASKERAFFEMEIRGDFIISLTGLSEFNAPERTRSRKSWSVTMPAKSSPFLIRIAPVLFSVIISAALCIGISAWQKIIF